MNLISTEKGLFLLGCYLLGSIPTGYLVTRALLGIDIREEGSHNVGATNVFRVVGIRAGTLTLAVDFVKGYLPIVLAKKFFPQDSLLVILAGLSAIIGHMWPVFLLFRGGKGVATGAGVFLALLPIPTAISIGVFLIVVAAWRKISLGSILAALSLPLVTWLMHEPLPLIIFSAIIGLLIVARHTSNIRRLMRGEESTVSNLKGTKQ